MAEETRLTCTELVDTVREMTPRQRDRYLARHRWLGELVDMKTAATFTGLGYTTVQLYHRQAVRHRREGDDVAWMWPEPDGKFGRSPAWRLRTLVVARATMPGRGKGGAKTRRRYDDEFRASAVGLVLGGKSVKRAASEVGIPAATLGPWVAQARKGATRPETTDGESGD
ncbi:MAG TPA: transposase [Streptosporangiaceae bacterium]|nr:transposase [Streptosporangiaceae bacterium]